MKIATCPRIDELPRELVDFGRRQIVNATMYKGDERRWQGRFPMLLPVLAVEIDDQNTPIGQPFHLITRDVSSSSVGLIYTDPITAQRLALQFTIAETQVNVAANIVWNGPMGPFYGAGAKFEQKLKAFPSPDQPAV